MNMIENGLNNLWATPIYKSHIEYSDEIISYILSTHTNPSFSKSLNIIGKNIFDDVNLKSFKETHIIPKFHEYCKPYFDLYDKDFDIKGWLGGYSAGYSMPKHNHSGSQISGIFYLLVDDKGGDLILHDPRTNANRGYKDELLSMFKSITFKPKTNDVIIFPSFLYHNVEMYKGSIRLALPVDLIIY